VSGKTIGCRTACGLFLFLLLIGSISTAAAQTCPSNVPHIDGYWTTLPYLFPTNPISATLLSNGKILIVSGSENDAYNYAGPKATITAGNAVNFSTTSLTSYQDSWIFPGGSPATSTLQNPGNVTFNTPEHILGH
jgi:hypothetical protein